MQNTASESCSAMTSKWIAWMVGTCGLLTYVLGGGGPTVKMKEIGGKTLLFVAGSKQQLAFLQQQVTAEKSLSSLAADFAGAHTTLQVSCSGVKCPSKSHHMLQDLMTAFGADIMPNHSS